MEFEIDVSGEDLLSQDYTICVTSGKTIVFGFKFTKEILAVLADSFINNKYRRYRPSKGRSHFKIRLYCIVLYEIFKQIMPRDPICLTLCRDFSGHETFIRESLEHLLIDGLGLTIDNFNFTRLDKNSYAHKYAYLMRKDRKNKLRCYLRISISEFEKFLK